jgi:hypothetical protein
MECYRRDAEDGGELTGMEGIKEKNKTYSNGSLYLLKPIPFFPFIAVSKHLRGSALKKLKPTK